MKFLVKYLVTAAVLAAAVWFGIPEIKARMESRPAPAPAPAATTAATPSAAPASAPAEPRGSVRAPEAPVPPAATPAAPVQTASAPAAAPTPVPATPATTATPAAVPEPAAPVRTGPRYDWGVLAEEAQAYNEEGKPRVKLPAGTVVEKIEERNSSGGKVLVCRVLNNRRWERGFVLKAASVVTFDCPFEEAPKEARDKIVRYFQLQGFVATRTAALREEHLKRNPHFTAYRSAATAYTDFKERAKELTDKRDAAQGVERTRIASQLERMKSEEVQLRVALEKAEIPYKKWKAEHGDGVEAIINDEQIGQWNDEIDEIKSDVLEYIPDL